MRDAAVALLARTGAKVTVIKDSPGFIAQRMCAMIANLGCEMAMIGIASAADVDTAMTLGLNYPRGPLALADWLGVKDCHEILVQMQAITGDDRYRPSQWLRRRAQLGLSATTIRVRVREQNAQFVYVTADRAMTLPARRDAARRIPETSAREAWNRIAHAGES